MAEYEKIDVVSEDRQVEVVSAIDSNIPELEKTLKEAEFQIHKRNFERAIKLLESVIERRETGTGSDKDDSLTEYRCFQNALELALYVELFKPGKKVVWITEDYAQVYAMYGSTLFELRRFGEARIALLKGAVLNPIRTDIQFELAEICKIEHKWDEYFVLTTNSLKCAYTNQALGRCYRNLGFYYTEKADFDTAIALYCLSLVHDEAPVAQSELLYISQQTGTPIEWPDGEEILSICKNNDIQFEFNEIAGALALKIAAQAERQGVNKQAKYYYKLLYDITGSNDVLEKIESLPGDEGQ